MTKIFRYLALILGVIVLILSFSRVVWLVGLLVALWFMTYSIRKKGKEKLLITFSILFFCFLFFWFFGFRSFADESVSQRLQLIKVAILMIKDNPVSGVGLNNFVVRLPEYWQSGQTRLLQPVHNIYLLILTETGLVGFLIFFWFLVLTFKRLLHCYNVALLIALSAILVLGLFDHYWFTLQQNQLLATTVFGLAWGSKEGKIKKP